MPESSKDRCKNIIRSTRFRAFVNVLATPLFLLFLFLLFRLRWKVGILRITAEDEASNLLWFGIGYLLLAMMIMTSIIYLNILLWAVSDTPLLRWREVKIFLFPFSYPFPLPKEKRIKSFMIMILGILPLDIGLVVMTVIFIRSKIITVFSSSEPYVFLFGSLLFLVGALYYIYLHLNLTYWMLTGNMIKFFKESNNGS